MTVTSNRSARRGGPAPHPPDGALLRVLVDGDDPLAGVPPAPDERDVSVSFSSRLAASTAGPALEALGYRTVGVVTGPGDDRPVVHVLVPQRVIDQHPQWWRAIAGHAQQAFSLTAGPVHTAFSEILRTHREPLR